MRKFDSGATRDSDDTKLDFEGFISPLVLKRYAEYLNKHRVQSDGNLRDSDNWQGMFGEDHYKVCMKSAFRHFMDFWLEHREGNGSETGIEDAICGLLFNVQAYLFKILKDKTSSGFVNTEELTKELLAEQVICALADGDCKFICPHRKSHKRNRACTNYCHVTDRDAKCKEVTDSQDR